MVTQNDRDNADHNDWSDPYTHYREFMNRPLAYPLLKFYGSFMDIKRYERAPFYFAPQGE